MHRMVTKNTISQINFTKSYKTMLSKSDLHILGTLSYILTNNLVIRSKISNHIKLITYFYFTCTKNSRHSFNQQKGKTIMAINPKVGCILLWKFLVKKTASVCYVTFSCTLFLFFDPLILGFFFAVNFLCRFNIASCFVNSLSLYWEKEACKFPLTRFS